MNDRNLWRGLLLAAVSLSFGQASLGYSMGDLSRVGPALFPLIVSGLLLTVALATIVRSRFVDRVPMDGSLRNILLILASLCGFALLSKGLNMTVGIVFMVFVASLAGASFSWKRNLQATAGLLLIAFAFQKLLGLQLPLY